MYVEKLDLDHFSPYEVRHDEDEPCECMVGYPNFCKELDELIHAVTNLNYGHVEREILSQSRSLADDIYSDLQKEYEWLTSDEQVAEMIRANEYEFDEEGNLV